MRTPAPDTRKALWDHSRNGFSSLFFALNSILDRRKTVERDKAVRDLLEDGLRIAYMAGLDTGYDMAATIFDPEGGEKDA